MRGWGLGVQGREEEEDGRKEERKMRGEETRKEFRYRRS